MAPLLSRTLAAIVLSAVLAGCSMWQLASRPQTREPVPAPAAEPMDGDSLSVATVRLVPDMEETSPEPLPPASVAVTADWLILPGALRAEPLHLETGLASFYGKRFAGRLTANGERFDPSRLTAAHPTLPFGTRLRVTNVRNGRSVVVRVNDRGPYIHGRIIDLSRAAAEAVGLVHRGVGRVRVELLPTVPESPEAATEAPAGGG